MAMFMTRVELHGAKHGETVYQDLHTYMKDEGFARMILGNDGVVYHLPPAEYNIEGEYTMEQVHEKARRAANRTDKSNAVLVSQYVCACWTGLAPVK